MDLEKVLKQRIEELSAIGSDPAGGMTRYFIQIRGWQHKSMCKAKLRRLDWKRNLTKSGICFVEWQERNFLRKRF